MILNKDKKYFLVFWGGYEFKNNGEFSSIGMQKERFQERAEAEEFFNHHVEEHFQNVQETRRFWVMLAAENGRITECRSHRINHCDLEKLAEEFVEVGRGSLEQNMWEEFQSAVGGWGDGRYVEVNNLYLDYPIPR